MFVKRLVSVALSGVLLPVLRLCADPINVLDFGAKPDGRTDSTAADTSAR